MYLIVCNFNKLQSNVRSHNKIALYLCKAACKQMRHFLAVISVFTMTPFSSNILPGL